MQYSGKLPDYPISMQSTFFTDRAKQMRINADMRTKRSKKSCKQIILKH